MSQIKKSIFKSLLRELSFICLPVFTALVLSACSMPGNNEPYFGTIEPPPENVVRYISGPEPESLDPQIGSTQIEQRIYVGLYEGLVEYHPETLEPIPAIAENWEISPDSTVFTFHLRRNARWSNGEPITAKDFVYTVRRGLDPKLASRTAGQAYYIKNAKAFNDGESFVQDPATGEFLSEKGARLVVPSDAKSQAALFKQKPELEAQIAGKKLVPVAAEDVGVEAVDDFTVRITLEQPVPFFIKILPHNFFRVVPEKIIKEHGNRWTQPENIVTSGAFRMKSWSPYHELVVEKNPFYWDAKSVQLDEIKFYPVEDINTAMNLYKAGEVDATYNRSVPRSWLFFIQQKKDHMDEREASIEYYLINTTKPPTNDVRVRRAFALALDKRILTVQRRNAKPLSSLVPPAIFVGYQSQQTEDFNPELSKKLLAEAGFRDEHGNYDPSKFPVDQIEIAYNTSEGNRFNAEIIQAQWKQHLGITVPLKNMETRAYIEYATKLQYKGFARLGYAADYIDPYSFLSVFAEAGGNNGTGWSSARFKELLDKANQTLDNTERYRMLSEAESLFLSEQPVIPLTISSTNWLKKPYVKGMFANPLTLHPWKFVRIERDPQLWDTKK
ncbi:MAG: peptide ABC transporter substrate-binding protein [Acidobacteriota bacterium]|nr:peptide ABC transporter substrate-binding protein [Acidobacteriota bacterium]